MFKINRLLRLDSYKLSHKDMYPKGTTYCYSNLTPRKTLTGERHFVAFGIQAYLVEFGEDMQEFFDAPKEQVLEEYKQNTSSFVAPNFSYDEIGALHDLGYVPLKFSVIAEGTPVPMKVPILTVESTHEDFYWLVNYIESDLSASIWHPATSATTAWATRREFDWAAKETGGPAAATDFQMHDFSYRGMENWLAAAASSAGHCLSSLGSDTVPVVPWVNKFYPGEDNGLIAASVPATEHSVMCMGGKEDELETFRRLLKTYPTGILSIVSDTWDFWKVLAEILPALKDEIMARDGKIVIRPDSGDPADIICGTVPVELAPLSDQHPVVKPEMKGAIEVLWDIFGGTVNEKGFKELDSHIGLIYGDGMYLGRIKEINDRLREKKFASTNYVAGVGSYTYQYVTRDTYGTAVKATQGIVNGEVRNIFKDPATDDGTKKSATGKLAVQAYANGNLYLIEKATDEQVRNSLLQPVWENGEFLPGMKLSYNQVRQNLKRWTGILERNGSI